MITPQSVQRGEERIKREARKDGREERMRSSEKRLLSATCWRDGRVISLPSIGFHECGDSGEDVGVALYSRITQFENFQTRQHPENLDGV
jgi:hypothetical protein